MDTYYLVPVAEYDAPMKDSIKSTNEFDQVTENILKTSDITEDQRAAKLREALNLFLNHTRSHKEPEPKLTENSIKDMVLKILESNKIADQSIKQSAATNETAFKTPLQRTSMRQQDPSTTDTDSDMDEMITVKKAPAAVTVKSDQPPEEKKQKIAKPKQPNFADVNPRNIVSTGRKRNKPRNNKYSLTGQKGANTRGGWISSI